MATEAEKRAKKAERQRKWRANVASKAGSALGASVSVHLDDSEVGVLDAIARRLYRRHPFDPSSGEPAEVFPGRAAAIRELVALWRKAHPAVRAPASREACGAFWRAESSYRRSEGLEAPAPPWKE